MQKLISCARDGALLVVRSDLAAATITGPDRVSWLNALLTQDLSGMKPGHAVQGLALNKKGRVLCEAWAVASTDRLLLALDATAQTALLEHFDHYLVMEDAEIAAASEPYVWVMAYGPLASQAAEHYANAPGYVAGRVTHFGHPAVVFALPAQHAQTLIGDNASHTMDRVAVASLESFDAMRIDLGVMRFGVEFSESTYPEEAGLDAHAISFNKGCYLGQEVVVKMKSRGHPSKKVVRLTAAGTSAFAAGDPVLNGAGEGTGTVSSSHVCHVLPGTVVAFATVRMPDSQPGTVLKVADREATVVGLQGLIG
ncbi:MAG: folate-binding protein YgfZ [Deltaproteobacteria bacterium]|nr:folate-binding protein YgfZ [Deltaproteobacteria bacterium]